MKALLIYAATSIFAAAIIFIIWAADTGQDYFFFRLCREIPFGDKIAHFLLIGTLTLLVNLSNKNRRLQLGSRKFLVGSLVIFVLITLEELSQVFFPNRSLDWLDLTANYLGIFVFGLFSTTKKPSQTN